MRFASPAEANWRLGGLEDWREEDWEDLENRRIGRIGSISKIRRIGKIGKMRRIGTWKTGRIERARGTCDMGSGAALGALLWEDFGRTAASE